MTITKLKKERDNTIYIFSFIIPIAVMILIFIVNKIFPFGNRSFLNIDMYHQYFPFLTEYYHMIKDFEPLSYSFTAGLGTNFVFLIAYYLATPTNLLALLVPEAYLMEFLTYMMVVKIGLCGFTFSYYLSKHFKTKNKGIILFACFYALSGYIAAYNWNVMWLDCIILAPIIILGLEYLNEEKNYTLYCLSLAYCIFSNYYLSIMICIYLCLYFFITLLPFAKNKIKAIYHFILYSLLSGGMAGVLFIPSLYALRASEYSESTFPSTTKLYFSFFDAIARHCVNVGIETGLDKWPNIYCGVAILFLFPIYIICKKIDSKKKILHIFLLIFLFVSFSSNVLTFIWHGFNYPNSLPSRQSFLYILLLLTLCFEAFQHIKEISDKTLCTIFAFITFLLILFQKLITDDAFNDSSFFYTFLFLALYALVLYLYRTTKKYLNILPYALLFFIILEAGMNMYLTSCSTVSRTNYLENYGSYATLKERNTNDLSFVRFERDKRVTQNDGMLFDYPSSSLFSSTGNSLVNKFYEKYGLRSSKVFYSFDGATPLISALLSTKYLFTTKEVENDIYDTLVDEENGLYLYETNYVFPFGFAVTDSDSSNLKVDDDEIDTFTPIDLQNVLGKKLGATTNLFDEVPTRNDFNYAAVEITETGYYYGFSSNSKITKIQADCNGESMEFKNLKNSYILNFGYLEKGSVLTISNEENLALSFQTYRLNDSELANLTTTLNNQALSMTKFTSTSLEGEITLTKQGTFILSLPYEAGWTLYVDGVKTEIALFEDMMISTPLSQGTHTISLSYYPKGLTLGICLSLSSIVIFLFLTIYASKKKWISQ
ncbi:MAG: YfhO family protein [Lachnospiraceae bacterium]